MDGFKLLIIKYPIWSSLDVYLSNIEKNINNDFSVVIENLKSLLESIAKQICKENDVEINQTISLNKLIKKAVDCLNFDKNKEYEHISSALATIAEKLGNLRNQRGVQAHGKELAKLVDRNQGIAEFEKDFLVNTTLETAKYLIQLYQQFLGQISYEDNFDYNSYLDELYGEINILGKQYKASQILYTFDQDVYKKNTLKFHIKYLLASVQENMKDAMKLRCAINKLFPAFKTNSREYYREKYYKEPNNRNKYHKGRISKNRNKYYGG